MYVRSRLNLPSLKRVLSPENRVRIAAYSGVRSDIARACSPVALFCAHTPKIKGKGEKEPTHTTMRPAATTTASISVATTILIAVCATARLYECDVVIAGGTLAALATAVTAAKEGAVACLIEPTDWVGGQMSASGVSAIDFAWHKITDATGTVDVAKAHRNPVNQPALFAQLVKQIGSPGACWVSTNCFKPQVFLDAVAPILEELVRSGKLIIVKEAVTKNATSSNGRIEAITIIERKFKGDAQK
jgi:hypothetical protein